ncbi:MAG: hypothetical protein OQK51_09010 [Kangiellaceae bacterium]|nr:hypothetical protein [Kangiellaceae bacterium]
MTWQTLKNATKHMDSLKKENEELRSAIQEIIERYKNQSSQKSDGRFESEILSDLTHLIAATD